MVDAVVGAVVDAVVGAVVDALQVPAAEALAGKIVALYFSASWCPPCKLFTPVLKAAYEAANKAGKRFEVVWVSSDYDAASQQAYMEAKHGDWLQVL